MDVPNGWYAVLALFVTTAGGVLTAWVGRGRTTEQEIAVSERAPTELMGADLTTLAGLATVVSRQSQKISLLETEQVTTTARLGALTRYVPVLRQTIQSLGGEVPRPDPADAHLIDG